MALPASCKQPINHFSFNIKHSATLPRAGGSTSGHRGFDVRSKPPTTGQPRRQTLPNMCLSALVPAGSSPRPAACRLPHLAYVGCRAVPVLQCLQHHSILHPRPGFKQAGRQLGEREKGKWMPWQQRCQASCTGQWAMHAQRQRQKRQLGQAAHHEASVQAALVLRVAKNPHTHHGCGLRGGTHGGGGNTNWGACAELQGQQRGRAAAAVPCKQASRHKEAPAPSASSRFRAPVFIPGQQRTLRGHAAVSGVGKT